MALSEYCKPVAYCEIDPYCQSVLLSRMQEGNLPQAPIWDDVRTLPWGELPRVDIIYGGFPCQDISIAGVGKGLEGERSSLFFEIVRLAKEIKPQFIFLENVAAIRSRGGIRVVTEIAKLGYDMRWGIISASSVGALHQRKRWFLLAYSTLPRLPEKRDKQSPKRTCRLDRTKSLAYSKGKIGSRLSSRKKTGFSFPGMSGKYKSIDCWQKAVSEMGKLTDGIPNRVDRIKALGNAVVPIQAKRAFEILLRGNSEAE